MTSFKRPQLILGLIIFFFLLIFITKSFMTMSTVPFYDFDEAHRAENAKEMKKYQSYFVPLTGSSFDRVESLKIRFKENPDLYLYYHLERPPLIYLLMIVSTSIFNQSEWAYRLPSFLLGMLTIIVFVFFAKIENPKNIFAIILGVLVLITSSDLWLSSQYAQMDTGITFFLTLSLLTLLYFCAKRKTFLIYLAGVFFGLGLLSKLQPAVIFIFPIVCLLFLKRINFKDLFKFILGFLVIFLPWITYLVFKFGIKDVVNIMPGFALTSASIIDIHHKASFFWYIRWWWESLRPGWTLFIWFFLYDLYKFNFSWKKLTLLSYIFGSLLCFSIPVNKIWWYVLPIIPAICYYVFLSAIDYLKRNPKIFNLSLAIFIASVPIFLGSSNSVVLIYGIFVSLVVFSILIGKLVIKVNTSFDQNIIFYISVILSLLFFLLQFPKIIPYHWNTKPVAEYYKALPYPKCLWLGDMPGEAVLFYSDAGEVPILNESSQVFTSCKNNYFITPERFKEGKLILRKGNIRLYQLTEGYKKLNE